MTTEFQSPTGRLVRFEPEAQPWQKPAVLHEQAQQLVNQMDFANLERRVYEAVFKERVCSLSPLHAALYGSK